MDPMSAAVVNGAPPDELARTPVPGEYVAAHLHIDDVGMFGASGTRTSGGVSELDTSQCPTSRRTRPW